MRGHLGLLLLAGSTMIEATAGGATTTTANSLLPPPPPDSHLDYPRYKAEHQRFHSDDVCDREEYNQYKKGLKRALRKRALGYFAAAGGTEDFPPTERVLHCPTADSLLPDWSVSEISLDTTWLVENTTPDPVVVVWVDFDKREGGVELSPLPDGATAVIPPGDFLAVPAFEGHVYRVRRLLLNGVPGPVLLQYRAGIRTVGGATNSTTANCPNQDIEPPRNDTSKSRTKPKKNLKCHSIETGFRNLSPCPLNAYFAHNGTESFRFHLGTDDSVSLAMKEAWTSAVKFETSYVPHAYVFRNSQTDEFVERYVLQPTRVMDCSKWHGDNVVILPSGEVVQQA